MLTEGLFARICTARETVDQCCNADEQKFDGKSVLLLQHDECYCCKAFGGVLMGMASYFQTMPIGVFFINCHVDISSSFTTFFSQMTMAIKAGAFAKYLQVRS